MTTNLVHNGGQRTSGNFMYPTLTWQSAGSWSNSFGEFRSYDNASDRNNWENGQKLDFSHNSITYYLGFKPIDGQHDANDFPTITNHSGAVHLQNGQTTDWWDRFISFSNIGTILSNSNNGTYSAGPSVTSITSGYIVTDDTVTNTDFTLLKNGSAYANTNISLTATTITLPSDAQVAGYTYNLTYDGTAIYSRTIDSKSFHDLYYDDSWTSSPNSGRTTNSSRILAVLGTIPSTANFTVPTVVGQTIGTRTFHDLNRSMRIVLTYPAGSTHTQFICYFHVSEINNEIKGKFESFTLDVTVFDESPLFTIGAQQTMSHTFTINGSNITISVNDWIYSDQPEGDGYVAPVTTTSNGGGKRRYPIISTNLFDRQRSIFSIGLTHKDENLF